MAAHSSTSRWQPAGCVAGVAMAAAQAKQRHAPIALRCVWPGESKLSPPCRCMQCGSACTAPEHCREQDAHSYLAACIARLRSQQSPVSTAFCGCLSCLAAAPPHKLRLALPRSCCVFFFLAYSFTCLCIPARLLFTLDLFTSGCLFCPAAALPCRLGHLHTSAVAAHPQMHPTSASDICT